jgi:hypothetical protein
LLPQRRPVRWRLSIIQVQDRRHATPAGPLGPFLGLAVCGRPREGVYLFYCDGDWRRIADTWHATTEEAMRQAELEFEGVSAAWQEHG